STYNEGVKKEKIYEFYNFLINSDYKLEAFLIKLLKLKLIQIENNSLYKPTLLGLAVAKSFLTVEKSLEIINSLKKKEKKIIDIVLELKALRNVYLTNKVVADLSKNYQRSKYFSNNFFSAAVLSLMDANYVKKRKTFSREFIEYIVKWTREIFNCDCKDSPYCECGRLNLERIILKLRIEDNFSIEEINNYLEEEYNILVFKGDIINYLESLIYSFESVFNISKGLLKLDSDYKKELLEIPEIIERIKN
ncbi:unnamed protein product, partial [marine sediment metagenome]